MRPRKADRWDRLVDKLVRKQDDDPYFHASLVAQLLRREHRAVVRMVKDYKELCRPHDSDRCVEYLEAWHHIENTCDDILTRLNARERRNHDD